MTIRLSTVLALLATFLVACGGDEPPPPPKQEPQGRAETRSIRNTEAVGYSGNAIANKIDNALNKQDEQVKKAQQQSEEQAPQ